MDSGSGAGMTGRLRVSGVECNYKGHNVAQKFGPSEWLVKR